MIGLVAYWLSMPAMARVHGFDSRFGHFVFVTFQFQLNYTFSIFFRGSVRIRAQCKEVQ